MNKEQFEKFNEIKERNDFLSSKGSNNSFIAALNEHGKYVKQWQNEPSELDKKLEGEYQRMMLNRDFTAFKLF